ncbi:tetratricopeptide repeat protein [Methanomicrobium antiquum]|uniref:Tetratricopeptide repeat protein n=1 Tax=Methanomicrobium antiquum TaxID=487686 RepID=A0AAF0FRB0_9EURY|nr:tetratricopeptide repeat protein [Methanomicrobium antiquum]WFN36411.1 tetratricopeptide repeat protein [Methanomicrobium antiquum]
MFTAIFFSGCTGRSSEENLKAMAEFATKANASAKHYDNMVESDPGNATAWVIRAMYYNNNFNQYDEALYSVNKALEINPELGLSWHTKGFILLNSGDKTGAALCYENATRYDPSLAGSTPDIDNFKTGGSQFVAVSYKAE